MCAARHKYICADPGSDNPSMSSQYEGKMNIFAEIKVIAVQ